jgi:hypothetical protein
VPVHPTVPPSAVQFGTRGQVSLEVGRVAVDDHQKPNPSLVWNSSLVIPIQRLPSSSHPQRKRNQSPSPQTMKRDDDTTRMAISEEDVKAAIDDANGDRE